MSDKQPKVRVMLQLTPRDAKSLKLSAVAADMTVSAYVAWMLGKANLPTCKTDLGTPSPDSTCSPLYSGYGLVSKGPIPEPFSGPNIVSPWNVDAPDAEPPTSRTQSGVVPATSLDPSAGSPVTATVEGVTGVESAFVQNGPLTKPDDASSSESQSTSQTDSSEN